MTIATACHAPPPTPRPAGSPPLGHHNEHDAGERIHLDPACVGADLDLDALLAAGTCSGSGLGPIASDTELALELSPSSFELPAGGRAGATLYMINRTDRTLVTGVFAGCGKEYSFAVFALRDGTVMSTGCEGIVRPCFDPSLLIGIAPRGRAAIRVEVRASSWVLSPACKILGRPPLAPGSYKLQAYMGGRDWATGSLTVVEGDAGARAPGYEPDAGASPALP